MGDQWPTLRVAAVQAAPIFMDREATVVKACSLIEEAGRNGADLIVFPECFIPGFPHWHDFYRARDPRSFKLARELYLNAVDVPGPTTDRLGAAARKAGAYVVMGIHERVADSVGNLYNGQIIFDRQGKLMGSRRKLMPTFYERLVHTGGDGRDVLVFETEFGGLGALMCGENSNPLLRYALLAEGERIHAMGWPSFPLRQQAKNLASLDFRIRNYAYEGKVFVVSAAEVFTVEMAEKMEVDQETMQEIVGPGAHSLIVDPQGEVLAGPHTEGETILYADIELEEMIDGRLLHHVSGHYQRFDIFQLSVNREPLRALHTPDQESVPVQAALRAREQGRPQGA